MTLRLLAVHAHPDDESSKGAASYAYYRSIGAEVMVVSCTGGEGGDVQNESLAHKAMAERDIAGLRRREMAGAQDAMGIEHRWLGYMDSGLPENGEPLQPQCFALTPLEVSGAVLVRLIREYRPQVMVTYDENGGYPHPDHIRTHELSMWAFRAASEPDYRPDLGEAWQISKVYFDRIFNGPRFTAVYEVLVQKHPDHPMLEHLTGMLERMKGRGDFATTQVPAGPFFEVRDEALRSHASQVSPDSSFFFWPNDIQREVWPWEDFQLVESLVETILPETDLFAGITDEDDA